MKMRNKITGIIAESNDEMVINSWKDNPDFEECVETKANKKHRKAMSDNDGE